MAYGIIDTTIDDDNWHLITNKEAIIQCSRDFIFRLGTSVAPDNAESTGIQADSKYLLSTVGAEGYVYIKRVYEELPLSVIATGDVL